MQSTHVFEAVVHSVQPMKHSVHALMLTSLKNLEGQSGPQEFKFLFKKFPSTH
jgi:hypothetical protein